MSIASEPDEAELENCDNRATELEAEVIEPITAQFQDLDYRLDNALAEIDPEAVERLVDELAYLVDAGIDLEPIIERSQLAGVLGGTPPPAADLAIATVPNPPEQRDVESGPEPDDLIDHFQDRLSDWNSHLRALFRYAETMWEDTVLPALEEGDTLTAVRAVHELRRVGDVSQTAFESWRAAVCQLDDVGGSTGLAGEMIAMFTTWARMNGIHRGDLEATSESAGGITLPLTEPADSVESRYGQLKQAVLSVAELAEEAWRLGRLDSFLTPWIRDELLDRSSRMRLCDNTLDLEQLFTATARLGSGYAELRRQLFSDLHHTGPEPSWRAVGTTRSPSLAIRAQSQVILTQPIYILAKTDRGSGNIWQFSILTGDDRQDFAVHTDTEPGPLHRLRVTAPELRDSPLGRRGDYEQLGFAFQCLGLHPHLPY